MSLHTTADATKKIFIWICAGIIVILFISITVNIVKSILPKKEIPPTVSFGKLPPIAFPDTAASGSASYVLDTLSGTFPTFPDQEPVYTIDQPQPGLLDLQNATSLISGHDFPDKPQALSDVVYQWTNQNPPYKILTYNIITHDFTLTSSYATDPDVIAAVNLGDTVSAINTGKSFLQSFNAFPNDIDDTKTKTTLYSINGTTKTLQPAISLSTTQIIQVDFFPKDVNKLPIYYPVPNHSLLNVLIGSTNSGVSVVTANVTVKPVTETSGTYPLKTVEQAFDELQTASPSAYIAAVANPPQNPVHIREVSLGYYLGNKTQLYMMPIYVFQGDNGFYGYVSAVMDAWIKK